MPPMRQRHLLALSYSHTHIRKTSFRQQGLDLTWRTSNIHLRKKSCFGTMGIFHSECANNSFPPFCIHNCQSCVAALTWWMFFCLKFDVKLHLWNKQECIFNMTFPQRKHFCFSKVKHKQGSGSFFFLYMHMKALFFFLLYFSAYRHETKRAHREDLFSVSL